MAAFVFACLVLTAYRVTRLIVKDDLPPVLWLRDRLVGGWRPLTRRELEVYASANSVDQRRLRNRWSYEPDTDLHQRYVRRSDRSPWWLSELLSCPWCVSAYVSGALVAATDVVYGLPVPWLVGPAVWGASALLASREWA